MLIARSLDNFKLLLFLVFLIFTCNDLLVKKIGSIGKLLKTKLCSSEKNSHILRCLLYFSNIYLKCHTPEMILSDFIFI